jgi:serine/threonine protein kinase
VDFVGTILSDLGVALTTQAVSTIYHSVVNIVRNRMRNAPAQKVLQTLHDLGCMKEGQIRTLIRQWRPGIEVTATQREELAGLLTNLTRTCRFHTTDGTPSSSYLRSERLLEQLLANLQPKRKTEEPVGPGRSDWKLVQLLGMGSFGEVWLGRAQHYPEPRAFKFITVEGASDWLRREGQALCEVKHYLADCPNVIEYLDIALDGTPYPFVVLEYVAGGSLEDFILAPASERPPVELLELMTGIARGLAAAHGHRIYHRDLKPANILLTDDDEPIAKIADFGLGRVDNGQSDVSTYASQGVVVGTSMYLPPEAVDPYSERRPAQDDVFAFGVIWYQVLTGMIERPPTILSSDSGATGWTREPSGYCRAAWPTPRAGSGMPRSYWRPWRSPHRRIGRSRRAALM